MPPILARKGNIMQEKTYTTFQIADICGVRPTTIIKWVKQKRLKAYVTLGGHRRVLQSDLVKFLREHNFPIPEALSRTASRVLIVEDEPSIGQMVKRALLKASSEVEVEWT